MLTIKDYKKHDEKSVYEYTQIDWVITLLILQNVKDDYLQVKITDEVKDVINLICKDKMFNNLHQKLNYVEQLLMQHTKLKGIELVENR